MFKFAVVALLAALVSGEENDYGRQPHQQHGHGHRHPQHQHDHHQHHHKHGHGHRQPKHHEPCECGDFFVTPKVPFCEAASACHEQGGYLAELNNGNFLRATEVAFYRNGAFTESWVRSFDGDSHHDACLMLSTGAAAPGGAVNVAADCNRRRHALCIRKECGKGPKEDCKCDKKDRKCRKDCKCHKKCHPRPPHPPRERCGCNCNCRRTVFEYAGDELPSIGVNGTFNYLVIPGFTSNDGALSIRDHRLVVDSNPFTLTTTDPNDHVKFLLLTNEQFAVPEDGSLIVEATIAGTNFGVDNNPFGEQVLHAQSDIRLAAAAMVVTELTTGLVFDFFITNEIIYILAERLSSAQATLGDYASYTQSVAVARTTPGATHKYAIIFDGKLKNVRWLVDGEVVYTLDNVGQLISREFMLIDRAGQPEFTYPKNITAAFGTFTVLDAYSPCNVLAPTIDGQKCVFPIHEKGLVKLQDGELNARNGFTPAQFVNNGTDPAFRLFGQGTVMSIKDLTVGYCKPVNV